MDSAAKKKKVILQLVENMSVDITEDEFEKFVAKHRATRDAWRQCPDGGAVIIYLAKNWQRLFLNNKEIDPRDVDLKDLDFRPEDCDHPLFQFPQTIYYYTSDHVLLRAERRVVLDSKYYHVHSDNYVINTYTLNSLGQEHYGGRCDYPIFKDFISHRETHHVELPGADEPSLNPGHFLEYINECKDLPDGEYESHPDVMCGWVVTGISKVIPGFNPLNHLKLWERQDRYAEIVGEGVEIISLTSRERDTLCSIMSSLRSTKITRGLPVDDSLKKLSPKALEPIVTNPSTTIVFGNGSSECTFDEIFDRSKGWSLCLVDVNWREQPTESLEDDIKKMVGEDSLILISPNH